MFKKKIVDYTLLLQKTSKEFVIVVRRTIQFEKLDVIRFVCSDHRGGGVDVALLTTDRLLVLRGFKTKKTAHIQEFKKEEFEKYEFDQGLPLPISRFLKHYHENILKLDQVWLT